MKARHIERRGNKLYAALDVPKDVQHVIIKRRFFQSLKTDSLSVAQPRADRLVAQWKQIITAARAKLGVLDSSKITSDPVLADALFYAEGIGQQPQVGDLVGAELAVDHSGARSVVIHDCPHGISEDLDAPGPLDQPPPNCFIGGKVRLHNAL